MPASVRPILRWSAISQTAKRSPPTTAIPRVPKRARWSILSSPSTGSPTTSCKSPNADEHPHREAVKQQREQRVQLLYRQPMGEARAERRSQHAGRDDERQRRQVDIANARRRQAGHPHAVQHVARSAGNRDRKPVRRGCADRAAQRHLAPREKRNGEERTARGNQARDGADHSAGAEDADTAGQLTRRRGLEIEQNLRRRVKDKRGEEQRER